MMKEEQNPGSSFAGAAEPALDHTEPMRVDENSSSTEKPAAYEDSGSTENSVAFILWKLHTNESSSSEQDAPILINQKRVFVPGVNRVDDLCYAVSTRLTNSPRHHPELREPDGAVEWERLLFQVKRSRLPENVSRQNFASS